MMGLLEFIEHLPSWAAFVFGMVFGGCTTAVGYAIAEIIQKWRSPVDRALHVDDDEDGDASWRRDPSWGGR